MCYLGCRLENFPMFLVFLLLAGLYLPVSGLIIANKLTVIQNAYAPAYMIQACMQIHHMHTLLECAYRWRDAQDA